MLSKIASTSNASSSRIWPNAYAANKFNLSANGFLKSFGKDKAYTLTRKKVNNPAFVCCDILGGEGGGEAISHDIFFFINLRSGGSYSETGCSFARHFAILSPNVGILQPRSQSSSAISDVTSPVKLVGKNRFQASSGHSDSTNRPGYEAGYFNWQFAPSKLRFKFQFAA